MALFIWSKMMPLPFDCFCWNSQYLLLFWLQFSFGVVGSVHVRADKQLCSHTQDRPHSPQFLRRPLEVYKSLSSQSAQAKQEQVWVHDLRRIPIHHKYEMYVCDTSLHVQAISFGSFCLDCIRCSQSHAANTESVLRQ